jgi:hypothetical protein
MKVKRALSAWYVLKAKKTVVSGQLTAKTRAVAAAADMRLLSLCVRKSIKVFKKGMLSLDFYGSGLD